MGVLTIHTGLNHFRLIDKILSVTENAISGAYTFNHLEPFLGIEALAQLGALHVRYLIHFEQHAFLLSLPQFTFDIPPRLNGRYTLNGQLLSHSESAFAYALNAQNDTGSMFSGNFHFATVEYDPTFEAKRLKKHYQRVFTCLQNAAENE